MRFEKKIAVALTIALGLFACTYSYASEAAHPHWSYEGDHGPEHWGHISKDYAACLEGKHQSPVDINKAVDEDLPDIAFSYKKSTLNIVNNGHTIQVNYDKGSSIKVDGVDYELVQFHFHNPSEHTVSGKAFANEMHLVHRNAKGGLAVVGVLIETGKEAASYKDIWANLPGKADEKRSLPVTVNADDLLPKVRTFYRYTGSLTTPPCSEDVTWLVLKTPLPMSEAQLKAFNDIFKVNNRPVQPVNDRQIKGDTATH